MAKKRKFTKAASVKRETATAEDNSQIKKRTSPKAEEHVRESLDLESGSISALSVWREKVKAKEGDARFLGEPVPKEEATQRWPHRYHANKTMHNEIVQARFHFLKAEVDGQVYCLEDDAFVQAGEGKESYICKIIEIFEAIDGSPMFSAQWYYRAADTVIQTCAHLIDKGCVFFSEIKDDNSLDCLVKKLRILPLPPKAEVNVEKLESTYIVTNSSESRSTISSDADALAMGPSEVKDHSGEKTMLDMYSGCGAMSTGLCLGANRLGVKLVTKWAVDINEFACQSLQLNNPETQVRNESADDFLQLLKVGRTLF